MRRLFFIILFCVRIFAANHAPFFTELVSPSGATFDSVKVFFQLSDMENDICTLGVSFSTDYGITWNQASIDNKIHKSNILRDSLIWVSKTDIGIRDFAQVSLKLIPFDNDTGSDTTTNSFAVKNFTYHDFSADFPKTAINAIGFEYDSTVHDNTNITYVFIPAHQNPCRVDLNYSIDNGANWHTASSNMKPYLKLPGVDIVNWNSMANLPDYGTTTISLKISAQDTVSGRVGLQRPTLPFSIDNQPPTCFWTNGIADTNIILMQLEDDIDSLLLVDTSRYTLNFGRKITSIRKNDASSKSLILTYSVKVGPDNPENTEILEVEYYSSNSTWINIRDISRDDGLGVWEDYEDVIDSLNAFHKKFKLRFRQKEASGPKCDNYFIDDITLRSGGQNLFHERFPYDTIDNNKWHITNEVEICTTTNSDPYAIIFDGHNNRLLSSVDIITNSNIETAPCNWVATTDVALWPNLPYTLTLDTLFDKSGNLTTPLSNNFKCRGDLNLPGASFKYKSINTNPDVRVDYTLKDKNLDPLSFTSIKYRIPGSKWLDATISGEITNIASAEYSGFFTWQTGIDLPKQHLYGVSLKIHISDTTMEGCYHLIDGLEINNNHTPNITISNNSSPFADTTTIGFQISDTENDTVHFEIFYSNDGLTWLPCRTLGRTSNITVTNYTGSFQWLTIKDITHPDHEVTGLMHLKVIPIDHSKGTPKALVIPVSTSKAPSIVLGTITGEQFDTIPIPYSISDKDKSEIKIVCQYSIDGKTWQIAKIANNLNAITTVNYKGNILWLSKKNIPGKDCSTVSFRAIPYDPATGYNSQTNKFHVDNNEIPTATFLPIENKTHVGEVPVKTVFSDKELDSLNLTFQYRKTNSTIWYPAAITETTKNIPGHLYKDGKVLTFTWNGTVDASSYSDSIWLRVASSDNDLSLYSTIGFYYSSKSPQINLGQIAKRISDTIPITFTLAGNSLDSITLDGIYSVDNTTWKKMKLSGTLTYHNSAKSGKIIWKSLKDIGTKDCFQTKIALRAKSHIKGAYSYSNYFYLDNNKTPSVSFLPGPVATLKNVYLKTKFKDPEKDSLKYRIEYLGINKPGWQKPTISKPVGFLNSDQYNNKEVVLTWNSSIDIADYSDSILVRIQAYDTDTCVWDSIHFFLGQKAPDVFISMNTVSEYSDSIKIPIRLSYSGKDSVTLDVEYSIDSGHTYKNIRLTENKTYPAAIISDTITWLSKKDIPHLDIPNVLIRIRPLSIFKGIWKSTLPFHVDNNVLPAAKFDTSSMSVFLHIPNTKPTPILFKLSDEEKDILTTTCQLRITMNDIIDTILTLPKEMQVMSSDIYHKKVISFDYFPPYYGDSIKVQYTILPSDLDSGISDSLTMIYRKFLGDFNANGYVDIGDLVTFAVSWNANFYERNLGPVIGEFPYVMPVQDSTFDIEDLSCFVNSWNVSRKYLDINDTIPIDTISIDTATIDTINNGTANRTNTLLAQNSIRTYQSFTKTYTTTQESRIYPGDRLLFSNKKTNDLSVSKIDLVHIQNETYKLSFTLPANKILLAEGILISFSNNIIVESAKDFTGNISINSTNKSNTELLLYAASLGQNNKAKKKDISMYVTIANIDYDKSLSMDIKYHGITQHEEEINQHTTINLGDIEITEAFYKPNIQVAPNPFNPYSSSVNTIAGLSAENSTAILVKKSDRESNKIPFFSEGIISIYDALGNIIVRKKAMQTTSKGNLVYHWNGTNKSGRIVGSGTYKAIIQTTDAVNGAINQSTFIQIVN